MMQSLAPWAYALFFASAMLASWFIGRGWGKRWPPQSEDAVENKTIDASIALLGLLLAFTFSMSLNRHDARRVAAIAHSNALGDFYTSASVMKEPYRTRLQDVLREYAQFKLERAHTLFIDKDRERAIQRSFDFYARATVIVADALAGGTPAGIVLINNLNNLTSTNATHRAAYRERLPWVIGMLLLFASMIPAFLIGKRRGAYPGGHVSGIVCFFVLVTLVIYVIFDLNHPTHGLIQVNQESLERVVQSMTK